MKQLKFLFPAVLVLAATACQHDPASPVNKPTAPTASVDDDALTRVSMLVSGTFATDMTDITSYGVEISETLFENSQNIQTLVPQEVEAGVYSLGVTGLKPNSNYYLRSFISNGLSKLYSSVEAKRTPETSVASLSDVRYSADLQYLEATIEDDGGREITDKGFVWGTVNDRKSLRREKRNVATEEDGNIIRIPVSELGEGTVYVLAYAEDDKDATGFSRIPYEHKVKDKTWDKVFQMSNYETNSTFVWDKGITLNPSSVTLQWKFLSNEWVNVSENSSQCNRLGQFCNTNENNSVLIRFSDPGGIDGQLKINAAALGCHQRYITKDGQAYSWPLNKWVVITIVSDGSKLHIYQNDTLIQSCEYDQSPGESWELERLDLSMTWDDGGDWPKKQAFNGYTAFIRVWSRPLSVSEIASTLCNVPYDKMEGLEACWIFNGIFDSLIENSASNNSNYSLDFSKCVHYSYPGDYYEVDKSSVAASAWITPSNANIPEVCE